MDAFVTGKLSEKAPATGLGGIVQNIPIVKAFSRLDKYNNVAETRAGISLALAAKQITPEEADVLTGKVDSYIEKNDLNSFWTESLFTGSGMAKNATSLFAGEDGEFDQLEWNKFVTETGGSLNYDSKPDADGNITVNPNTGVKITGKVTTGAENFNKTATEKAAQKAGEDKQEKNRQKRNQEQAKANAAAVKVKTEENVIAQQKKNPVYGRAKGGLMKKNKK